MSRVYFHIDLNAFFANAELILDPTLAGKPVAVSGTTRRSVVSTASYEARKFGVHSAMPIGEAEKLCPDLVVVNGHYHFYEQLSEQFIGIIRRYTGMIEQASIDECYADVTETIMKYPKPLDLAWRIQKEIKTELQLPCSIGIGPNKFLAKMASDMKKPMGITVLRIKEVPEKLWPLNIKEMRGVGTKTVPYLEDLGIHTIGELANYQDVNQLKIIFGKNTDEMIRRAHGYDDSPLVTDWDAKSMGVSTTLLEDVTDYEEIRGVFRSLAKDLSSRMKADHKLGSQLSIRIKYYDFRAADRSVKLERPVWSQEDLFLHAISLFDSNWEGDPVRLLGISVADLMDISDVQEQMNLFDEHNQQKEATADILSELNGLLNGKPLKRARDALKEAAK